MVLERSQFFWEHKSLEEMTSSEWESLCDGCGKCCLHKLEDEETGEVYVCNVACRMLELESCQCGDYDNRKQLVPDCLELTPESLSSGNGDRFHWLPVTCAYHLLSAGKPLPEWHPLVSGRRSSVHESGNSVRGRVVSEDEADDLQFHITDWVL